MMHTTVKLLSLALALSAAPSFSQSLPRARGGDLVTRATPPDLGTGVETLARETSTPAWIGYAVPLVAGSGEFCGGGRRRVHRLEGDAGYRQRPASGGDRQLYVLMRLREGHLDEVRTSTSDCEIDVSETTLTWWNDVASDLSLTFLQSLLSGRDDDISKGALTAIAHHADDRADEILASTASPPSSHELREKSMFWLGAARSERGFLTLSELIETTREPGLREQLTFALHVSEAAGATAKLVEMARGDSDSDVREKAVFWLSQEAGEVATAAILESVQNDPELEVKKKAVFALSQLPPDEGVPLLVEVAQTHPQREIRKKAFFWLGQSGDPRAIALFEKILLNELN